MDCLHCNKPINFCYHILRHSTQNTIVGYGEFCSTECAIKNLETANHGDSDYFASLSVIKQKYWNDDGIQTFYSPKEVREIRSLLEPTEEVIIQKPRYQVMRASKKKRSTNDIIKNDFFTGKCEPIMTGKNLCSSK